MKYIIGILFLIYINNLNAQEIKPDSTLPVQLIYFYATPYIDSVVVEWGTATETQNYGYDLERAQLSPTAFEWIAFINGNGNSNSPKYYSYTDTLLDSNRVYYYRLKQIDFDGAFVYSDTITINYMMDVAESLPLSYDFELMQNYPNPFNPTTNISFHLNSASKVKLLVYNSLGQIINTLIANELQAGYYQIKFTAEELSSGVYYYQLISEKFISTKMMILAK